MFSLIRNKELREIRIKLERALAHVKDADARADDAEKALADSQSKQSLRCSFCGKSSNDVAKLIAGPTVFICDECTELCMQIILEGRTKAREAR